MARISSYGQDGTLNKLDKVIGTDSTTGATKNYSIDSVLGLVNEEDLVDRPDGGSFAFKSYEAGSTNPQGIINLNAGSATQAAFSAVNQIYISVLDKSGLSIAEYLDNANDDFIKISKRDNINQFGIFEVTAVANHDGGAYKKLTVTPRGTNGNINPNDEYFVSNYSALYDQDFSDDSVTEFSDVTSAGSGQIITGAERTSLTNFTNNGLVNADVVNNVTSTAVDVPLSAAQGKVLKDLIDAINTLLTSDNTNLDSLQEVVDYIETNRTDLDNLGISNITGLQAALDLKQNTEAGKGLSANDFTTILKTKLDGIAENAEVNVNADWSASTGDAHILNKPTDLTNLGIHDVTELRDVTSVGSGAIITGAERTKLTGIETGAEVNVQANWNESDSTSDAFIQNKPSLAPSNAEQNVQANWNESDNTSDAFIQNKPTIPVDTNTTYDLTVQDSGDNAIIRLTDSSSANDDVTIVAGNNVTLTPNSSNLTIDIDLSTGAVADGATTLTTGDQVFDYLANFARTDVEETFSNNVIIQGDLTVSGTTTTVNTTELNIGDSLITLNSDLDSSTAPSENSGIEINRGSANDAALIWNESSDKWQISSDSSTYNDISIVDTVSDLSDTSISGLANDQVLKYNSTTARWENQADAGGIQLTDLSVGAEGTASGDGSISYSNTTGVFTYTPPDLSSYLTAAIDGTGTPGVLPKMSDSDTITDSAISESGQVVNIDTTGAVRIPDGVTGDRPAGVAGMFRFNTTDSKFEGYDGTDWGEIGGGGGASAFSHMQDVGDGSTTSFALGNTPSSHDQVMVYLEGVYQEKATYSISGSNIVFNTAPPNGYSIEVKYITGVLNLTDVGEVILDELTGDGTASYALSATPQSENYTNVYIEGVYQEKGTYSVSGANITFSSNVPTGYSIEVSTMRTIAASSVTQTTFVTDTFTANGSTNNFTLVNGSPSSKSLTMVFIQGVYQAKSNYNLVSGQIQFGSTPSIDDVIEVISISAVNMAGSPVTSVNGEVGAVTVASKHNVSVISSGTTAVANTLYVLTANLNLTLPASPAMGDSIKISNRSGVATCQLLRNGNNILGAAADLTLNTASASFELVYTDAANGWVIIGQ